MVHTRPLIAIVDDDESVLKAVRRLLRAFGLQAETYASGRAFLESLAGQVPDCLILDIHMPGLDGYEVRSEMAASDLRIPVVYISADPGAPVSEQAEVLLLKPFTERQLLEAVDAAMRQRQGNRSVPSPMKGEG